MVVRKALLFIVVLIFYVPALAFAAPDGKAQGVPFEYLQQQIDSLRTDLEAQYHGISGLISYSTIDDCVSDEFGPDCNEGAFLHINVPHGSDVGLIVLQMKQIMQGGVPTTVEETLSIGMTHVVNADGTGDKIDVLVNRAPDDHTHTFSISSVDPVYAAQEDFNYNGNLQLLAQMITPSQVLLRLNDRNAVVVSVKDFKSESIGAIDEANIAPYEASDTDTTVDIVFTNYGDLKSDYIVTLTDFTGGVVGPPSQGITLEPYESATLIFELHSPGGFDQGMSFLATLKSTTGRIYDKLTIPIPSP